MALAEIMEAKKELVAQRAADRDEKKPTGPEKKEETKPELIQTVPVSQPVVLPA